MTSTFYYCVLVVWFTHSHTHSLSLSFSLSLTHTHIHTDVHIDLCPVEWGCRIHWLHLCRGIGPPPMSVLDMILNNLMVTVPVMLELWRMQSTSLLPSLPGPLWPGLVAPDRVLSMGQIEINCVLMLNWIAHNRTVLISTQCTYAKLNCLK